MNCPKIESDQHTKDETSTGKQYYKHKKYGCFYSVEKKSTTKTPQQKHLALQLYLEDMGFRAIGRVLNISYRTVFQWGKKWEKLVELPKSEEPIEIIELDETLTYIQRKNYYWLWIATRRFGKHFIDFVCGKREILTFSKLYNRLKNRDIRLLCVIIRKVTKNLFLLKNCTKAKQKLLLLKGLIA